MPGVASPNAAQILSTYPKTSPLATFGNPTSYTAAATQQAGDYDKIMQNYQGIFDNANANPVAYKPTTFTNVAPQTTQYNQSSDVTNSLNNLSSLAGTGGYDAGGIADLRARAIAPIRSVYANAEDNLNRSKSLSGGYDPGLNATTAKMTREEADQIGAATSSANAGIAQNVAANKIAAAPSYASAAAGANAAKTAADQANANTINQINEFNASNNLSNNQGNSQGALAAAQAQNQTKLGATQGMTSLYGTTPALTSTFGNQVMQAASSGQNQQQINNGMTQAYLNTASHFV